MLKRLLCAVAIASTTTGIFFPLAASATSPLPKPTCVMSSPPGPIYPGTPTRLIWYSEHAERATISPGVGQVRIPTGYADVHPSVSTLYTMTVTNASGSNTCGALITIAVQNPPTLLYYPTVTQPIVFTPIAYSNVYVPYNGYGGYYVPYDRVVYYDEWYEGYPSRTYNQKYDFWADFTRGPSTGPSLFGETYSRYNQPYTEVIGETLPSGDTRSITRECIDGIGCRITGMNRGWTIPDGEPGPLDEPGDDTYPYEDPRGSGSGGLLIDPRRGMTEEELLAPPDWNQPGWQDSLPYPFGPRPDEEVRVDYTEGGGGYAESVYAPIPTTYHQDETVYPSTDPYLIRTEYTPTETYYSESSYGFSESYYGI